MTKISNTTINPINNKKNIYVEIGFKEFADKFGIEEKELEKIESICFRIKEPQYKITRELVK